MSNVSTPESLKSMITRRLKETEDSIRERLADLKTLKREIKGWDISRFPEDTDIWVDSYSASIRVPWGIRNMRLVRAAIGRGWNRGYKSEESSGDISISYSKYVPTGKVDKYDQPINLYISVRITMSAEKLPEGSCKKILVEEETRSYTVQTFKVICSDGRMETLQNRLEVEQDA